MQKVDGWTSRLKPAKSAITTKSESAATLTAKLEGTANPQPAKPEPTIGKEDPYLALSWKQSQKKQNLGTILVTKEILENPLARELYDRLKDWKTMKAGKNSYRYSQMENGTEFLQKWSLLKLA